MVRDLQAGAVNDVSDLVGDDELEVLRVRTEATCAENSSPTNSPSFTLIAPTIPMSTICCMVVSLVFIYFIVYSGYLRRQSNLVNNIV